MPVPDSPQELPEIASIRKFAGMNTRSPRDAIGDEELYWSENFISLGEANLRTVYDKGSAIYTAPSGKTVVWYLPFNLGTVLYYAVFLSDGTAYQIRVSGGSSTTISSSASTFYTSGGDLPFAVQWATSGLVIVSTAQANGYWAWDGTTLYSAGDLGPSWLTGQTDLTPTGTTTSGTATITAMSDTSNIAVGMTVTGTGVPSGTTVVSIDSATQITVSANSTASGTVTLTINWAMPTGIKGTSAEIYQSRVSVLNGATWYLTAAGNGTAFATSLGGVLTKSSDSFLRDRYVAARQANGFLYLWGDSSVNVVSNVQTSGSPSTTTFTNTNVDPQIGTPWRDSVVPFGRGLVFANTSGIYTMFGGAVQRVSPAMDTLFETLDTSSITPSAGVGLVFKIKCYCLAVRVTDPTQNLARDLLLCWDGQKFFVVTQSTQPTLLATQEIDSSMTAVGSDGSTIFELFQTASSTLDKRAVTKLWTGRSPIIQKQGISAYVQLQDNSGSGANVTVTADSTSGSLQLGLLAGTISFVNNQGQLIEFTNSNGAVISFFTGAEILVGSSNQTAGLGLGLTIESKSPDFTISLAAVGYRPMLLPS